MKTELTVEQSAKLIELGVPKERASSQVTRHATGVYGRPLQTAMQNVGFTKHEFDSVFAIADLLSMLPKTIEISGEIYEVNFLYSRHQYWKVYYSPRMGMDVLYNIEKELIDALWNLLADLIEGNYVKPQEL